MACRSYQHQQRAITCPLDHVNTKHSKERSEAVETPAKSPRFMQPAINKAFNDAANQGAEWIPDQFALHAANLYFNIEEQSQIPRVVADNLQKQQVERSTILVPRLERGGRPYLKGSISSDNPAQYTASSVKTSQKSITVKGLASRFLIDDAAQEDSAIAVIPALQRQIVMDLNDAMEDALINGDDSGSPSRCDLRLEHPIPLGLKSRTRWVF